MTATGPQQACTKKSAELNRIKGEVIFPLIFFYGRLVCIGYHEKETVISQEARNADLKNGLESYLATYIYIFIFIFYFARKPPPTSTRQKLFVSKKQGGGVRRVYWRGRCCRKKIRCAHPRQKEARPNTTIEGQRSVHWPDAASFRLLPLCNNLLPICNPFVTFL